MNLKLVESSSFGSVGILWEPDGSSHKIHAIVLSEPTMDATAKIKSRFPHARTKSSPEIDTLADRIEKFLSGLHSVPESRNINIESCTTFQQTVLKKTLKIPRGTTITYKSLAAAIGKPSAARAVGNALANNPFPILVPCHRVVASNGTTGGFNGGGHSMKSTLLNMESQASY